jgi:hypothetical protein
LNFSIANQKIEKNQVSILALTKERQKIVIVSKKSTTTERLDSCDRLLEKLAPSRAVLLNHPIYKQLDSLISLRIFMESHVFAVWDFMSLIKTLQNQLTCLDVPWLPPADINSARMVNEIVLAEETDEVSLDFYISHYDLYIAAMEEIGADTEPIKNFICSLRQGLPVYDALTSLSISESTKAFVLSTMKTIRQSPHEVTASFLLGREDIIPAMFRQVVSSLENLNGFTCKYLRLYLDRHNFLDEDKHVPIGKKLLNNLCSNDHLKWEQAFQSASSSLQARVSLWDGVSQLIQAKASTKQSQ